MTNYLNEIHTKGYLILNQNDLIKDEILKKNISQLFNKIKLNEETLFNEVVVNHNRIKIDSNSEFDNINTESLRKDKKFFQIWKSFKPKSDEDIDLVELYNSKIVNLIYGVTPSWIHSEFTCFKKNCSIIPHTDLSYTDKDRICVVLSYFNNDWKKEYGGCLVLDGKELVIPNEGTIAILDFTKNNILHEVTEVVENKNRFCLTTFVNYKNYNGN